MGRKEDRKKLRDEKKKARISKTTPSNKVVVKEVTKGVLSLRERLKKVRKCIYSALGFISLILGLFFYKDDIHKLFSKEHDIYSEENFIRGIFLPESITDPFGKISINYGTVTNSYFISDLIQGVKFSSSLISFDKETPFNLKILLKNNRLYISAIFKDIQKQEVVGQIDFDKWSLFKPNLLDYKQSDQSLEVMDRGHNIIFNLVYTEPNTLELQGYSVGIKHILVISEGIMSFPVSDKQSAMEDIQTIKLVFDN